MPQTNSIMGNRQMYTQYLLHPITRFTTISCKNNVENVIKLLILIELVAKVDKYQFLWVRCWLQ